MMEALAELPVLGLLARQHMAWAGRAAHGCLVLDHSTIWEGIPFRLHTVQAMKGAAAPPSFSRTPATRLPKKEAIPSVGGGAGESLLQVSTCSFQALKMRLFERAKRAQRGYNRGHTYAAQEAFNIPHC